MSDHPVIDAKVRDESGRQAAKRLRREGFVPAILYSHDTEPEKLQVEERQLRTVIHAAGSANFLIDLNVEGRKKKNLVMLQEAQMHPLSKALLHVDFHGVAADEELTAEVTLEKVGTPKGISNGGVLDQVLYAVEVTATPDKLPETIEVDVSDLDVGDSLHIGDLKLPEGVNATADPEASIFSVTIPTQVPEPEEEIESAAEPEVIGEEPEATEEGEGEAEPEAKTEES